jgi:cell division protein FtsB
MGHRPPDLAGLPVAGITPRRLAFGVAAVAIVWIVVVIARQVGAASEATARAEQLRDENARLEAEVAALERELVLIQEPEYVAQEARGYGLGRPREVPFSLGSDAPGLPPDAPGSAAVRLGEEPPSRTPLEAWLSLLFGPSD